MSFGDTERRFLGATIFCDSNKMWGKSPCAQYSAALGPSCPSKIPANANRVGKDASLAAVVADDEEERNLEAFDRRRRTLNAAPVGTWHGKEQA